ncbi:hypothetical protein, partial [Staphylococcus aureus]|uniref:hypothetical protein n=1 Tax=Staphylococcus aureus TaxID=1280 RepID=UPI003D19316A
MSITFALGDTGLQYVRRNTVPDVGKSHRPFWDSSERVDGQKPTLERKRNITVIDLVKRDSATNCVHDDGPAHRVHATMRDHILDVGVDHRVGYHVPTYGLIYNGKQLHVHSLLRLVKDGGEARVSVFKRPEEQLMRA